MPKTETIERFIAMVESNQQILAIETFYAADASMQENYNEPIVGKKALIANEKKTQEKALEVQGRCIRPVFVNGDYAVIRWRFRFSLPNGAGVVFEELAYQRWNGELIQEEQFFYDPKQVSRG